MTKLYMVLTNDWNQDYYGTFTSKEKAEDAIKKKKSENSILRNHDFWIRQVMLDEWDEK